MADHLGFCDVPSLVGNLFGPEGAMALAKALLDNGTLTSVELRDNKFGDEGWGAIFAAICGNKDSKIMSMDASSENIGPAGVKLIVEALRTSVTGALTRVDVRHNKIAGDGAAQLAAAVLGNLKIEMFNEIPIKEMRADSLTVLDLKEKHFGVEGGMVVAGLIPVMGGLTALNLSSNRLKDEGVIAVCEAIQSNKETKLASLNMGANSIGPIGAKSVAAMVAVTGALIECDLSNNDMGEEGEASIRFAAQGKAGFILHL
jgi:Ran GTPase-activating protein (RanGAP) involved in mRNA processing and transport